MHTHCLQTLDKEGVAQRSIRAVWQKGSLRPCDSSSHACAMTDTPDIHYSCLLGGYLQPQQGGEAFVGSATGGMTAVSKWLTQGTATGLVTSTCRNDRIYHNHKSDSLGPCHSDDHAWKLQENKGASPRDWSGLIEQ